MKSIFRSGRVVLVPEDGDEADRLARWKAGAAGQLLALDTNAGSGVSIKQLGKTEDVSREARVCLP